MFKKFLFKLNPDLRKFAQNSQEFLLSDWKAFHVCECSIDETKPYVVAYLEPSNYSRYPILPTHELLFIDLIPNLVSALLHK